MIPRSMSEQDGGMEEFARVLLSRAASTINCCVPAIVCAYDSSRQTITAQPAIRRRIRTPKGVKEMDYPLLTDVPVLFVGGGGFNLTFPVQKGDECLVLFSDVCIDAWWQSGEVQGQILARQHDLSDGIAIIGLHSAPHSISSVDQELPSLDDLMLAGKKMSSWMGAIGDGPYFDGDTLVLSPGRDDDEIQTD